MESVPFAMACAIGQVPNCEDVHKFGINTAVGTGYESVWTGSTLYTWPTAATTATISSASASDATTGTGAWTAQVEYLDSSYERIREDVTLTGQTPVTLSSQLLRFNRIIVTSTGSGGANAGIIYVGSGTVTSGVPATVYGRVEVGYNQSDHGMYSVPAGKTMVLMQGNLFSDSTKVTNWQWWIRLNKYGYPFQKKLEGIVTQDTFTYTPPGVFAVPEKSDLDLRVKTTGGGGQVAINFEFMLLDNQ